MTTDDTALRREMVDTCRQLLETHGDVIHLTQQALWYVLLLSARSAAFLAGLGAFLLAHGAYAAAFVVAGVAPRSIAMAAVPALLVGAVVLRWLWPRLHGPMRAAVPLYVVVILAMACTAAGHASTSGQATVAVAAVVFALSDLAVARERFVHASFTNRAWGLPAYYAAQLMLAGSVA